MPEVVRSFDIPPDLPADKVGALRDLLAALPRQQQRLADALAQAAAAGGADPPGRVGVVREIRFDDERRKCELVYDVVAAASLVDVITTTPRPPAADLVRAARQLCGTLAAAYAGETGLRHGGLCSQALRIDPTGQITILDFGVAECFQAVLSPTDPAWLDQVCECVAPELWKNPGRSGQACDVFAAGVLLYQLATGVHPFGAIRDDAEDCKYQILIEIPVSPHQRAPSVPEALSSYIYRAIRSEPQQRFHSFEEMRQALPAVAAGLGPQAAAQRPAEPAPARPAPARAPSGAPTPGESTPSAASAEAGDAEEQARLRYLEEQARLKEERAELQRRQEDQLKSRREQQALRRLRIARILSAMRRHAVLTTCAVLLVVGGVAAGVLYARARGNAQAARIRLDQAAAAATAHLRGGDAPQLAAALALGEVPDALSNAVKHIRELDPQGGCTIADLEFNSWARSGGTAHLMVGEQPVGLRFARDSQHSGGFEVTIDNTQFVTAVVRRAEELARSELASEQGLAELVARIRSAFQPPCTAAQAATRLAALLAEGGRNDAPVLSYLEAHGQAKEITLGIFRRVRGEDAVQCEVSLTPSSGVLLEATPVHLMFQYRCNDETRSCHLNRVRVDPLDEPDAHKRWCIQQTLTRLGSAFAAADAEQLAEWSNPQERDDIARTLAWTGRCRQAELYFSDPAIAGSTAQVQGRIRFTPGILNDRSYTAEDVLGFELDGRRGWRTSPGLGNRWPASPPALTRQLRGQDLLNQLRSALETRDAAAYADLFGGATAASAISEMFKKVAADGVLFDVAAREDEHNPGTLYLDIQTRANDALAAQYPPRSYGFELRSDALRWDGRGDPLWSLPGLLFTHFTERFANATWGPGFDELLAQFEQNGRQNMTPQEAETFAQALQAVDAARQFFQPAGSGYVAGLPERVTLRQAPNDAEPAHFRLVCIAGEEPYVLYMQEREVRVSDLDVQRPDRPWEIWSRIVGPPPENQAVGLTLDEAEAFAAAQGCRLPTIHEWESAAEALGATPQATGPMGFYGGVWEMCRASEGEPGHASAAAILGGCWLDHEGAAEGAAGPVLRRPLENPGFRFGTVGFRLCRPIRLTPALIERISTAQRTPGAPSSRS